MNMKERRAIGSIAVGAGVCLLLLGASVAGEQPKAEDTKTCHRKVKKMGESLNKGLSDAGKGLGVRSKGVSKNLAPYSSRSFGSRGEGDSSDLRAAHEGAFASQYAPAEMEPAESRVASSNDVVAAAEPASPDRAPPAAN